MIDNFAESLVQIIAILLSLLTLIVFWVSKIVKEMPYFRQLYFLVWSDLIFQVKNVILTSTKRGDCNYFYDFISPVTPD